MSDFTRDLTERVVRTFLTTFLMTYLAGLGPLADNAVLSDLANADLLNRAAVAALVAAGTLVLGFLTKNVGSSDTASVLTPSNSNPDGDTDTRWRDVWGER